MYANYRLKLFLVLLTFAILLTTTISFFDYIRLKEEIVTDNEVEINHASTDSINALYTVEKVYELLNPKVAQRMEGNIEKLLNLYDANNNFSTWNFQLLAEEIQMDIYIIDDNNVIQFSNVQSEIGLDFAECCKSLSEQLTARRNSGNLFIDEIDLAQHNGKIKKFGYKATHDKRYLIELGYDLENEETFQQFNFLYTIDEIVKNSSYIEAIHILNYGGHSYGKKRNDNIPQNRQASFEKVSASSSPIEVKDTYKGEEFNVKYIPFNSPYDTSATGFKVVEIIYNSDLINPYFATNYQEFIIQLTIIAIFTLFASSLIANWFSKPIHYAYHDSLTKIKNRTAFDEMLEEALSEKNRLYILFILDIDNFKLVNDRLGHAEGDKLLKAVGKKIDESSAGRAFRLGGDEFAIVWEMDENFQVDKKAEFILEQLNQVVSSKKEIADLSVSVSMGVACSELEMTKDTLYKRSDRALYAAKQKGKNQYKIFSNLD